MKVRLAVAAVIFASLAGCSSHATHTNNTTAPVSPVTITKTVTPPAIAVSSPTIHVATVSEWGLTPQGDKIPAKVMLKLGTDILKWTDYINVSTLAAKEQAMHIVADVDEFRATLPTPNDQLTKDYNQALDLTKSMAKDFLNGDLDKSQADMDNANLWWDKANALATQLRKGH